MTFPYPRSPKTQLLFISLSWFILAVAINPQGEFPINDDWAFANSVKTLVETGRFVMSSWSAINLIAQTGWGALFCLPFGFSFTALRLSSLVAGLFGLWGTHRLIQTATDNQWAAFLGTLLVMVNPMYLGLSSTFMTDIPFYAAAVWSLSYLAGGLKKDSWRWMLVGLLFAIVALLVRQFGIALFAGFSVAYVARKGINVKSIGVALAVAILGLGVQAIYQRWLAYLSPDLVSYNVQASNFLHRSFYKVSLLRDFMHNTCIGLVYTGLFVFPYLLLQLNRNSFRAMRKNGVLWLILSGLVLGMWIYFFDGARMPFWWNMLNRQGLGPLPMRDTYFHLIELDIPAFLQVLLVGVTIGGILGGIGVLYYLIRGVQYLIQPPMNDSRRVMGILLFSFLAIYFLPLGIQGLFDRYLLMSPVILFILIDFVENRTTEKETAQPLVYVSLSLYLLYGLFSLTATHDYLAWNRVRWQSLNDLMKQGISPRQIDGGFEFNGWYLYDPKFKPKTPHHWWWVHDDTYLVGAGLLPGYSLLRQYPVETWLPWGIQGITIGRKNQETAAE